MISVAMTTYNGENFIKEQIDSILSQSMAVDEIVVCDDCSTDRTIEVIRSIIVRDMSQTQISLYENEKNLGYIRNFYKAISKTRGDLIFLSDQDDVWETEKISRMSQVMADNNLDVLCSNFSLIDENGHESEHHYIVPEFITRAGEGLTDIHLVPLLYENVAQGCTYCFSGRVRNIYLQANYDNLIHDYQIMMIGAALESAAFLNEKLIRYRIHSNNSIGFSEKKTLKNIKFRLRIAKPNTMKFLDTVRAYIPIPHHFQCVLVTYLRLPVWRAVIKRFTK